MPLNERWPFPIYTHQTTYVAASYDFPIKGNPSEDIKDLSLSLIDK